MTMRETLRKLTIRITFMDCSSELVRLIIRDCGWCATRSVGGDHCLFSEHPTRAQIETMMKAAYKHDVSADVLTTLENY